ncbi:MAG: WbqC family protein [Flavobacteriales bacterium]
MIPVLPAFYFGSVEHYRVLAKHPKVIIDIGEHYERQSYRNRTTVIGPNGINDLVVQIARKSGEKMPMCEVGLSYKERWPQQHLHAIRSAYGKTPWFIHYIDAIEEVLLKKYDRLVDLDLATMHLGMQLLGLKTELDVREDYVDPDLDILDLRTTLQPKKPLPTSVPEVQPYYQVFADRHGFVGRLSVLDLVCNCGPEARSKIRS